MANEILVKTGSQFMFADHAVDFGAAPATAGNSLIVGSPTDVQMDMTSLAVSGGARASTKSATLGATRANRWRFDACIEHASGVPADGETVDFYWAGSPNSTAATGNPGAASGTDGDFGSADPPTAGELGQLEFIGTLVLKATVVNIGKVGVITPFHPYGMLVVVNNSTTAFHTAMDETHIVMTELIDEVQ